MKTRFFSFILALMLALLPSVMWAQRQQGYAELVVNNGEAFGDSLARYTITFKYGVMPEDGPDVRYFDAENTPAAKAVPESTQWVSNPDAVDLWNNRPERWYNVYYYLNDGVVEYRTNYLITRAVFEPSFANARPRSTSSWFCQRKRQGTMSSLPALTSIEGIEYLNTSEVTDMWNMFYGCEYLTSLDVSHFDTSNVEIMRNMFANCSSLTSLDVSNWDTHNVVYMESMFSHCSSLTSLDVSNWDTGKVVNMNSLFHDCSTLTSLDVSNWNTSNVTTMSKMFKSCSQVTSLDVSDWDISNVTTMYEMFRATNSLQSFDCFDFSLMGNSVDMGGFYMTGSRKLKNLTFKHLDTSKMIIKNSNDFILATNPQLETFTIGDVKAFLKNKTNAASILTDIKKRATTAKLVIDDNATSAQIEWLRSIWGDDEEEIEMAEGKSVVESVTVTMRNDNQDIFSSEYDLDFSNSTLKAYIASAFIPESNGGRLMMLRITDVPAGTGVVLKKAGDSRTDVVPTHTSNIIAANMLVGTPVVTPFTPEMDGNTIYVFSGSTGKIGKPNNGGNMGAGRGFLAIPTQMLEGLKAVAGTNAPIRLVFDDEEEDATAIEAIDSEKVENVYYNLNGQRVNAPAKGLYIVNGKKVLVK